MAGHVTTEKSLVENSDVCESSEEKPVVSVTDDGFVAPIELLTDFLCSSMLKDFETALDRCNQILVLEPHNELARALFRVITRRLMTQDSSDDDDDTSDDDDDVSVTSSDNDEDDAESDDTSASSDDDDSSTYFSDDDSDSSSVTSSCFSGTHDEEVASTSSHVASDTAKVVQDSSSTAKKNKKMTNALTTCSSTDSEPINDETQLIKRLRSKVALPPKRKRTVNTHTHLTSYHHNKDCAMRVYLALLFVLAPLLDAAATPKAQRKGSDALLKQPIIDGHNDLPWNLRTLEGNRLGNFSFSSNLAEDPKWNCTSCFTDLPRLKKGRVGAQFWVAYVSCKSQYKDAVEQTMDQIDVIKRLINRYPDDLQYAESAAGIEAAIANKKIASLICVEGGHSIDSRMSVLRLMYELGARYLTLTHTCNTPWADASPGDATNSSEHNGISTWGKKLVHELNRLGMMVDLSHVSAKTMKDAITESRAPVIFSHSSAHAVCAVHRNVQDDVLEMVKQNRGVVMVNFYSDFVNCNSSRDATINDVVDHINHIRNVAGVDHVGIGSDYDGVSKMPTGLEDVSKYPDLFDLLAQPSVGDPNYWSEEDLTKLAGGNLLRVFREVEKVRDSMKEETPDDELIPEEDLGQNTGCRTDGTQPSEAASHAPITWAVVLLAAAGVARLN